MSRDSNMQEVSAELEALISRWCNRQATAEEVDRLEALLWQGKDIRAHYRRCMNLHAALHSWCEGEDLKAPAPIGESRNSASPWVTWGGWGIAAALVVLFALNPMMDRKDPSRPDPVVVVDHNDAVGVMVNESGARFDGESASSPVALTPGPYDLEEGIVHFRLTNGVDVVMRGPAQFELVDAMNMTLERGVVRAIVPESGQGFTIASPDMMFEDLGTEFGLSVGEDQSQLYVFTGQVNARKGTTVSSVFEGESLHQDGDEVTVNRSVPEVSFPAPEDVGYQGWIVNQPLLTCADGLIAYFPFEQDPQYPDRLENLVIGPNGQKIVQDGLIEGARWVSGRWSEKRALLFDRSGDAVKLEVPGEFDEISMSAWIYVDRLDFAVNALFVSDGWSPGDLHWQILRTQDPILAVHAIHERGALLKRPIRLGRWIHVAAVLSKSEGRTRYYVDGQLAQENRLPAEALITPGPAQLGDWVQEADDPFPQRSFKGKMDEFAIWNRALTEEEIRQMTRSGVPSLLQLADSLEPVVPAKGASFGSAREDRGR